MLVWEQPLAVPALHHFGLSQMLETTSTVVVVGFLRLVGISVLRGPATNRWVGAFLRLIPRGADTYHDFRPACAVGGHACWQYSEATLSCCRHDAFARRVRHE